MTRFNLWNALSCLNVLFGLLDAVASDREDFQSPRVNGEPSIPQNGSFPEAKEELSFIPLHLLTVHEKMTPLERLRAFGTEDSSATKYTVFTLPKARNKRETNAPIKLSITIDRTVFDLNLKFTDDNLATNYTPVWEAHADAKAYNNIRYDPSPNAMRDVGEFNMYHDLANEAAVVVYKDYHTQPPIIEGVIGTKYVMKTLPERFWRVERKNRYSYFVEPSMRSKRSMDDDTNSTIGYYLLVEVQPPSVVDDRNPENDQTFNISENQERAFTRDKRMIERTIYPEVMVVLDHNAVRNHSTVEALRYALSFWNGVNMIYRALNEPKIRFTIVGIIISMDHIGTPYISADTSIEVRENGSAILRQMETYFYEEKDRFPIKEYDIVIAMTTMKLYEKHLQSYADARGYSNMNGACSTLHDENTLPRMKGVGIIRYDWMFGGIEVAAHEIAHLFGIDHDNNRIRNGYCNGYLMAPAVDLMRYHFQWSGCSRAAFRDVFSKDRFKCMDNRPERLKLMDNGVTLSGRWLTLDGQCRNYGYQKACQLPGKSPCMIQGCKDKGSDDCVEDNFWPMPGTKCGENMHCDISETNCVSD